MLKGNPLDEPAITVTGDSGPGGESISVRSRPADGQPVRITI